ncbi:MAG: hypothetical protein WBE18_00200, partial [Gammaproteobacteria bacterium]
IVHIAAKPIFLNFSAEALAENDSLLEKFRPQQIKTIIIHACKDASKPQYAIVTNDFFDDGSEEFIIKDLKTNSLFKASPIDLINNKEILRRFKTDDIYSIFLASLDATSLNEREGIRSMRKNSFTIINSYKWK